MQNRIRKPLCLFGLLVLVMLPGIDFAWAADAAGEVVFIKGRVFAEQEEKRRKLALKSEIQNGDTIITRKKTRLGLRMNDGAVISLGSSTRFVVHQYLYSQAQKSGDVLLELIEGAFRIATGQVGKLENPNFKVQTELVGIGIRGTDFWGGFSFGKGLDVALLDGKGIILENAGGKLVIKKPGFGTTVTSPEKIPAKAVKWSVEKIKAATELTAPDSTREDVKDIDDGYATCPVYDPFDPACEPGAAGPVLADVDPQDVPNLHDPDESGAPTQNVAERGQNRPLTDLDDPFRRPDKRPPGVDDGSRPGDRRGGGHRGGRGPRSEWTEGFGGDWLPEAEPEEHHPEPGSPAAGSRSTGTADGKPPPQEPGSGKPPPVKPGPKPGSKPPSGEDCIAFAKYVAGLAARLKSGDESALPAYKKAARQIQQGKCRGSGSRPPSPGKPPKPPSTPTKPPTHVTPPPVTPTAPPKPPESYGIYELFGGGSIWVGPESGLRGKASGSFRYGGMCRDAAKCPVKYRRISGAFGSQAAADKTFCSGVEGSSWYSLGVTRIKYRGKVYAASRTPGC